MKISAVIITFQEEKNIAAAIRSVDWADEILVVDSNSTDKTVDIAKDLGAKVISREWTGFASQKQFAADSAENDWILSLDADERVSDELRTEIEKLKAKDRHADGYTIPRLSTYMGLEIHHGGWYPDRQLRFFDRRKGRWKDVVIHESVAIDDGAEVGSLSGDILHFSVENASHHHRMISERYAPLAAKLMFENGRRTSPLRTAFSALAAFIRGYFLRLGFLDGFPGFCIAFFAAYHTFLKNLLLYEMQSQNTTLFADAATTSGSDDSS
ncbi:MAG: glycosyltransferase family 2 protein [Acidobacteriota bacterium]